MRYRERFSAQPADEWAAEYAKNLTALAENALHELNAPGTPAGSRLLLSTSVAANPRRIPTSLFDLATNAMRAVAAELVQRHGSDRVALLDLAAKQAANGSPMIENDGLHLNDHGTRVAWDAARQLLRETGLLAAPPATSQGDARAMCMRDGSVQVDGALLDATRRCAWRETSPPP